MLLQAIEQINGLIPLRFVSTCDN